MPARSSVEVSREPRTFPLCWAWTMSVLNCARLPGDVARSLVAVVFSRVLVGVVAPVVAPDEVATGATEVARLWELEPQATSPTAATTATTAVFGELMRSVFIKCPVSVGSRRLWRTLRNLARGW